MMIFTLLILLKADEWTLVKAKNGITVYTREVEGSGYLEFRGETTVKSSVDALVAVLYDTPIAPEWLHDCSFAMTLEEIGFEDNYIFHIYDLPFPVSNRKVILHSKLSYTEEGARLDTEEANSFCDNKKLSRCQKVKEEGLIKVPRSRGHYLFIRINEKSSKVIWQQHIEPGGSIPDWLANALVVDIPYNSLLHLKELVKDENYHDMTAIKLRHMWLEQYQQFH
ncbi:MAG: START domain-containing protein [Sulfurimonadaceae bacterium]